MNQIDAQSKQYHRVKHLIFFINILVDFLLLRFANSSGLSALLKAKALHISSNPVVVNGLYVAFFSLIFYLIHFPINIFSGYYWEHKFKLSDQTWQNWLQDYVRQFGLTFVLFFMTIQGLYFFLRTFPDNWWMWAGTSWIILTFVLAKVTPDLIIPMFFKYSTVNSPDLKKTISSLFEKCGVYLKDVYTIDLSSKTKKANAFFCGLGKNRRVVLGDTLINNFSNEEIEVVVAHELGHYKHRDILKVLIVSALFTYLSLYLVGEFLDIYIFQYDLSGKDDIVLFPWIAFWLYAFSLIFTPIINIYSRHIERQADQFSIEVTKKPHEFISLMEKLARMNLSETTPNKFVEWFLYDHPTIEKRITFAKKYLTVF